MGIQVMITEKQALMCDITAAILNEWNEVLVLKKAPNWQSGLKICKENCPNILLIDIFQYKEGLDIIHEFKQSCPDMKVVLLTFCKDQSLIVKALNMGTDAYVAKDADYKHLISAVQAVLKNEDYCFPPVSQLVLDDMEQMKKMLTEYRKMEQLTKRERQVLELIARGLSNLQIAGALDISDKTVKSHVSHLLRKLGLEDRTQATIFFLSDRNKTRRNQEE